MNRVGKAKEPAREQMDMYLTDSGVAQGIVALLEALYCQLTAGREAVDPTNRAS